MKGYLIDVPVLLIFFKRDDTFKRVFDIIKQVKPSTLLLWQDGARENNQSDIEGITRCRAIAEDIDWECTVYKKYNDVNYGCDPSTFYSHRWAFTLVETCIILEDDQVPTKSYFPFCKELLDKYENDYRISHICGMNLVDCSSYDSDYLFSIFGSNCWASWRRVVSNLEENYDFLHNECALKNIKKKIGKHFDDVYKVALQRESTGIPYWESILCFGALMNNQYAIIPKVNMVTNCGNTADSTHSQVNAKYLTKEEQRIFGMKANEISFPLKHPKYVIEDFDYMAKRDGFFAIGHPYKAFYRRVHLLMMYLVHGEFLSRLKKKYNKR